MSKIVAIVGRFAVGGAGPPLIDHLTRELDNEDGGAVFDIRGRNFTAAATVTVGGTSASVQFIDSTTLRVTAPAHTAGKKSVVVNDVGGSDTLINGFEYFPAPVTVYREHDFEDDTLGGFGTTTTNGGTVGVSTAQAHTGVRSCRCFHPSGGIARLEQVIGSNPMLNNAEGLWQRVYMYLPTATVDNADNGQIKLALFRPSAGGSANAWAFPAIGVEFQSSQPNGRGLGWQNDADSNYFDYAASGIEFGDGKWLEFLLRLKRAGSVGEVTMYLNGRHLFTFSAGNMGSDTAGLSYTPEWGIALTQNGVGDLEVFLDDISMADGLPAAVIP